MTSNRPGDGQPQVVVGVHVPACNAGCLGDNHRLFSEAEAEWWERHDREEFGGRDRQPPR